MEENTFSISGLYYRYGCVSDEEIRNKLKTIKIVKEGKNGYYPLTPKAIALISDKPRNVSLTFDATKTTRKLIKDLVPYKNITYLVKSSSRFFLKPDIGEIFDQIPFYDRFSNALKAICFHGEYELLEDTEGEHFLMSVTLLK